MTCTPLSEYHYQVVVHDDKKVIQFQANATHDAALLDYENVAYPAFSAAEEQWERADQNCTNSVSPSPLTLDTCMLDPCWGYQTLCCVLHTDR